MNQAHFAFDTHCNSNYDIKRLLCLRRSQAFLITRENLWEITLLCVHRKFVIYSKNFNEKERLIVMLTFTVLVHNIAFYLFIFYCHERA